MPATRSTTILNGTDLGVYLGGNLIALATNASITLTTDMRDVSNKDTPGWGKVLPGIKKWTVNAEGLVNYSSTYGFKTLVDAQLNKTALTLTMKIASNPTGDYYWSGTAYISNLTQNGPLEGNMTWQVTFVGDGALAFTDPLA